MSRRWAASSGTPRIGALPGRAQAPAAGRTQPPAPPAPPTSASPVLAGLHERLAGVEAAVTQWGAQLAEMRREVAGLVSRMGPVAGGLPAAVGGGSRLVGADSTERLAAVSSQPADSTELLADADSTELPADSDLQLADSAGDSWPADADGTGLSVDGGSQPAGSAGPPAADDSWLDTDGTELLVDGGPQAADDAGPLEADSDGPPAVAGSSPERRGSVASLLSDELEDLLADL